MLEIIEETFKKQDELNKLMFPDWKTRNFDFALAAIIESAEAIDHLNWKWWKHDEVDTEQAVMELVDIYHFLISICILNDVRPQRVYDIVKTIDDNYVIENNNTFAISYIKNIISTLSKLDVKCKQRDCGVVLNAIELTLIASTKLGCTMNLFWSMYFGKSALNEFRRNGYQDGTYVKIWGGEEDNVHLMRLIKDSSELKSHTDKKEFILSGLESLYNEKCL